MITLLLLFLVFLLITILHYVSYTELELEDLSMSRFDYFKFMYNSILSGSTIPQTEVVTDANKAVMFGKVFHRTNPQMRPMLRTVFHENDYDVWKSSRKVLVRDILSPLGVRRFTDTFWQCALEVVREIQTEEIVDAVGLARNYMIKILCRAVYGRGQEDEEEFFLRSTQLRHEESAELQGAENEFNSEAMSYFERITSAPANPNSILYMLNNSFDSKHFIQANSISFILGGYTACVSTIVFSLYELAGRQDIQDLLKTEDEKMYSDVLKEVLRMYPPFSSVFKKDTTNIDTTTWILPLSGLHYDKRYYSNPSQFQIGRNYPKDCYCPFGIGQRRCPGEFFSKLVVQTFLACLVSSFNIKKPSDSPKLKFSKNKFTTCVESLNLFFTSRPI